ncbi:hypothetical protein ME785_16700 [Lactobacillus delbrueckii]|nr:hypothetical protein ME785_16700 [Lactobacillus delbrueckii]
MTPNLTAFTDVDSQNLPDVMVSVQFILAIGENLVILVETNSKPKEVYQGGKITNSHRSLL